jgi:ATP-binding protein involved in chromosome partitioning
VALNIAEKGLLMFRHVGVPILGILETMSGFGCGECGHVTSIFGEGGAKTLAESMGVPLLGQVPIDADLVRAGDEGEPIVFRNPKAPSAIAYSLAADKLVASMASGPRKAVDSDVVPLAVEGVPNDPANRGKHSLAVYWSDGWKWVYGCVELRAACPCAACVDEFTGVRKIKVNDVDPQVYIDKALPVGRYGVNLVWTDGHSTGIYTYKYLRELEARKMQERPEAEAHAH